MHVSPCEYNIVSGSVCDHTCKCITKDTISYETWLPPDHHVATSSGSTFPIYDHYVDSFVLVMQLWGGGRGGGACSFFYVSPPLIRSKDLPAICHERILEQARPSRQRATVYRVRRIRGNASAVKENGWEKKMRASVGWKRKMLPQLLISREMCSKFFYPLQESSLSLLRYFSCYCGWCKTESAWPLDERAHAPHLIAVVRNNRHIFKKRFQGEEVKWTGHYAKLPRSI